MQPMWTHTVQGGPEKVNHGTAIVGDYMFVFGGYSDKEDFNKLHPIDVHIFNTRLLKWKRLVHSELLEDDFQLGKVPFARYGHGVVANLSSIYLWGGRNNINGNCSTLFKFCTNSMRWNNEKTIGNRPSARDGHTISLMHDDIYIFGGWDSLVDQLSNELFKINIVSMQWTRIIVNGSSPDGRDYHTSLTLHDCLIICGGRTIEPQNYMATAPQDIDIWEFPCIKHCNSHGDSQILLRDILGWVRRQPIRLAPGQYSESMDHIKHSRTTIIFNSREKEWLNCPVSSLDVPDSRRSHTCFMFQQHLYLFGGFNLLKKKHQNDLWKFCFATQKWSHVNALGHAPCPRRRHSCVKGVGNRIFVYGGTCPLVKNIECSGLLKDLSTLHVLDFEPSLKTICLQEIISSNLDIQHIPNAIRNEIEFFQTET